MALKSYTDLGISITSQTNRRFPVLGEFSQQSRDLIVHGSWLRSLMGMATGAIQREVSDRNFSRKSWWVSSSMPLPRPYFRLGNSHILRQISNLRLQRCRGNKMPSGLPVHVLSLWSDHSAGVWELKKSLTSCIKPPNTLNCVNEQLTYQEPAIVAHAFNLTKCSRIQLKMGHGRQLP